MQLFDTTFEPLHSWFFHPAEEEESGEATQAEDEEDSEDAEPPEFDDSPATSQSPTLKKLLARDAMRSLKRKQPDDD